MVTNALSGLFFRYKKEDEIQYQTGFENGCPEIEKKTGSKGDKTSLSYIVAFALKAEMSSPYSL